MRIAIAASLLALSLSRAGFLFAAETPARKEDAAVVAFVGLRRAGNVPGRGDAVARAMEAAANENSVPSATAQTFRARMTDYIHYMAFGGPLHGSPPTFKFPPGVLNARSMLEKIGMPDAAELAVEKDAKATSKISRLFYDRSVFQFGPDETVESLTVYEKYLDAVNSTKLSPATGYENELKRPSAKWGSVERLMDKLLKETPRTQTDLRKQLGDWWKTRTVQADRRSLVYTCEDGLLVVIVDPTRATLK
jgi:hypothetical protein